ncbi:UNVERIFIED_CONTAM: hypothetical protein H355_001965 [Colinus virginianus]|nr:hypothetical protein H355_001965 [Colinus virginianus]
MKCPAMPQILLLREVLLYTREVTAFTLFMCLFEGCVLVVSVIEQLAQWHNSTVKAAVERLCNYIPEKLQGFCYVLAEVYGPHIAELIDREMNADVVCHSLKLCKQDPGQPLCHLYPPPKVGLSTAIRKAKRILRTSKVLTLRGYHWRGRDCDDKNTTVYPGRRPDNWDVKSDSNCNGIWGVDPKDGIPYEEKFCKGASSRNLLSLIKSLARNQLLDNPAIVIYATIGNDVCNGNQDTLAHMTTPKEMFSNVMQALRYLDSQLPNSSHVILTGLVDGRFLWDNLHNRYHPLGQLNRDVTYSQLYSFLNCLQVSPCSGWLTANETLRNLTSERALQLSSVLKDITTTQKFTNFDVFYMDFPLKQTAEEWHKMGGEPWQLIEPVDGFHPSQVKSLKR